MKKKLAAAAFLCIPMMGVGVNAFKAPAPSFKVERVVMMMRHGIRPPTKANPVPAGYSSDKWPSWPVDFGLLTPNGAKGVKLLGQGDRAYYAAKGLFANGCPEAGAVILKASSKQRAIKTAENWGEGFMPGCTISVSHPEENGPDPIFHGLDDAPAWFDGTRGYNEASAALPKGGVAAETRAYKAELTLLAKVLGCAAPACPLLKDESTLVAAAHDRPEMEGPIDIGSTASQTFLLEYLEGMPMKDVGWGRITPKQISTLLRFHPLKFKYSNRPDYVARGAATPIALEIVKALTAPDGAKLTLLAGHDTNIADLGGFMRAHWAVPSYPADDVPPGSAFGFELIRDTKGVQYVRAFYRAQTMDQLRNQRDLTGGQPAFRQYIALPGCGNSTAARACTLKAFVEMVKARAIGPSN